MMGVKAEAGEYGGFTISFFTPVLVTGVHSSMLSAQSIPLYLLEGSALWIPVTSTGMTVGYEVKPVKCDML